MGDINLKKSLDVSGHNEKAHEAKEAFRSLLADESVEKERLELLENILERSNVQFASIADKVSVDFGKFVTLLLTHDLAPLLEAHKKAEDLTSAKDPSLYVVISSDLLTDISNCQRIPEEEAKEESVNVLSGIFIYGALSGLILSLLVAIIFQFVNVAINARDLIFVLLGCVLLVIIPMILIVFEPYLKNIQKKHNDFFRRMMGFFIGK